MQVVDCVYDYDLDKYVIQFVDDEGITWFKHLDTNHVYYSPKSFKEWLNSLIEDIKIKK